MKVILLQDVAKLGRRNDVVEAPNGYAMNKLIPQHQAEPATPQNLKKIEAQKEKQASERAQVDMVFKEAIEILEEKMAVVKADSNEKEHLFKAVSEADIVEAFKAEGATIVAGQILIKEPIKTLGEHSIELQSGDEKAEVTIKVESK